MIAAAFVDTSAFIAVAHTDDEHHLDALTIAQDLEDHRARLYTTNFVIKEYSLTDAISFTIMTRLGLNTAFAFDRHFGQYGWRVLQP
jgi:predicted nucleic acid-binding protein